MLTLSPSVPIYLCAEPVDCRRGFDGLAAAAQQYLGRDAQQGGLFLFTNRRGDQLRALCWDRNGWAVLAKRLSRGRFRWPRVAPGVREVRLELRDLAFLIAGLETATSPGAMPALASTNLGSS